MTFASPIAAVSLIEKGNLPKPNEEATAQATEIMRRLLTRHRAELHLTHELHIPDSLYQQAYQQIFRAAEGIAYRQRLETSANLPAIDHLLAGPGPRYVLLTALRGFTRTSENYSGQLAKTIGVGLLTMGMVVPVSVKARSDIYFLIYDRQQRQVVYFNQTPPMAEQEPLDEASVENQLRRMLGQDFPLAMK
ncbi:hypothetical protein GCM10023185_25220 [Hymenobacter saemangeumensis]|uniref:Uncharacterized protein n=1 Tax=Hymenobacter saemangeumensis TaxID=1084522 RepID=A0ABP8IID0_9BACT